VIVLFGAARRQWHQCGRSSKIQLENGTVRIIRYRSSQTIEKREQTGFTLGVGGLRKRRVAGVEGELCSERRANSDPRFDGNLIGSIECRKEVGARELGFELIRSRHLVWID
jgi:hypothetical protein